MANRVSRVDQLFYKKGWNGRVSLLITKVVDDFIIAGFRPAISEFFEQLNDRFKLIKIMKYEPKFNFLVYELQLKENGDVQVSIHECQDKLEVVDIPKLRRNSESETASDTKKHLFEA